MDTFGFSHPVYETLPMICDLANLRIKEGIEASQISFQNYKSISGKLKPWQPTQEPFSKDCGYADQLYRKACLIFLESSFHGPNTPNLDFHATVEPYLGRFYSSLLK